MWPPQKSELAGKRPRILVVGGQSLKSKEHSEVEKTHLLLAGGPRACCHAPHLYGAGSKLGDGFLGSLARPDQGTSYPSFKEPHTDQFNPVLWEWCPGISIL